MYFHELLLMSYILHGVEMMMSSVCLNLTEQNGFKVWQNCLQPELCTHSKLLTLYDKYK